MKPMDATKTCRVTPGMRKVLRAIHEGKEHRASWNTYEALTVGQFAVFVSGQGWTLLPAGNQLIAVMLAKKP